jgi:branched-chain amino acid transport system substrate-binding protein
MMKALHGVAAAAAVFALSAMTPAAAEEIVIGLNMVKSGVLKTVGEATETAVDIAVAEINAKGGIGGKQINLIKFDTGSDPKQAATGTQKFAQDDKALAVIGPFSSGEAAVAFPVGERLGIVEIPNAASTPGLTKGFTYAWRFTARNSPGCSRRWKRRASSTPTPRSSMSRTSASPTSRARSSIRRS